MEDFHPSTKVKALLGDLVQFSRLNPHSVNYDPGAVEVQMVDGEGNIVDDAPTKSIVLCVSLFYRTKKFSHCLAQLPVDYNAR